MVSKGLTYSLSYLESSSALALSELVLQYGVTISFGAKQALRDEVASEAVLSMRHKERDGSRNAFNTRLLHLK